MGKIKISNEAVKAIKIGSLCSVSYLAVYIVRNILGAVSPQMIESGDFTTEEIGLLSSVYFVTYALGQLINGAIGDKIRAKYMISFGLFLAGISNSLLATTASSKLAAVITYGAAGFFLSMIYGPMTKVVAENTQPIYATRCSLGYTFASFLGTPLAGILAAVLAWQWVFLFGSMALLLMGVVSFCVFTFFEKKGVIEYGKYKKEKTKGSVAVLVEHKIIKWTAIAFITGVVRTTVVFWLPTYLNQYLGFSTKKAAMIFTVSTFILTFCSFTSVFIYERLHHNVNLTVFLAFLVSSCCFVAVWVLKSPILNTILLVAAIFSSNCASTMLYSRYCPSLRDTGMVSAATGFLDFISYISAGISSTVFANAVSSVGWNGLVLIWLCLVALGAIISFPSKKVKNQP
ncbi:MAG: MFS transporter [Clostridia bacterium]|nr:MFS transporter [Clostridia bacterium]